VATFYDSIEPQLVEFIARQHLYFVATAAATGRVNMSPKGLDTFRVLDPNRVAWLNGTGSGNETAAHVSLDARMTIMFCSFDTKPWILRLYGRARMVQPGDADWDQLVGMFPPLPGARQVFDVRVEQAMTACGFGVPTYEFTGDRPLLEQYATNKGPDGLRDYQRRRNAVSIDGFDTHLPVDVLDPSTERQAT
jgi:hypothetical protein